LLKAVVALHVVQAVADVHTVQPDEQAAHTPLLEKVPEGQLTTACEEGRGGRGRRGVGRSACPMEANPR
jgi:hypothetical protein